MPSKRGDLQALKRLIRELERVLKLEPLPRGVEKRSEELFRSIYALTDDLIEKSPASVLGSLGGQKTAERGSEYFKQIAALRKTRSEPDLHIYRGAPELDDADAHAPAHPANKCVQ